MEWVKKEEHYRVPIKSWCADFENLRAVARNTVLDDQVVFAALDQYALEIVGLGFPGRVVVADVVALDRVAAGFGTIDQDAVRVMENIVGVGVVGRGSVSETDAVDTASQGTGCDLVSRRAFPCEENGVPDDAFNSRGGFVAGYPAPLDSIVRRILDHDAAGPGQFFGRKLAWNYLASGPDQTIFDHIAAFFAHHDSVA